MQQTVFDSDKLSRLILRFALPTILSLLINSFYNIVDQIFLGWGVGFAANAATGIVFPVVTFTVAVYALIGDGAATYFSLSLGQGEPERARESAGTALALAILSGLAILTLGQLLAHPLLRFLRASDTVYGMALTYLRITLLGVPLVIVSSTLTSLIRADGSPNYAMLSTITGCLVNIILDALFVLVLPWGVAGAALATLIGQATNFCIALAYLKRFRQVRLTRADLRVRLYPAKRILFLGLAGFINQFAGTVYMTFVNGYLVRYGALSIYGADIPIAVFGITLKINQVCTAVMGGIATGMQPVLGYHYGRGNYAKVKACIRTAVTIAVSCGCFFCALLELFPHAIIRVFGRENALYTEFGVLCIRIFLLGMFLYGFSMVATGLFQAIGKPLHSTFMALARQIIFMLPLVACFAPRWGLIGILAASPVSDVCAFLCCLTLFCLEMRRINSKT